MDIGQILVQNGVITDDQLTVAKDAANGNGGRVDRTVIKLGLASEEDTLRVLSEEFGIRYIDLKEVTVDEELLMQFPTTAIFRHSILPLHKSNGRVVVATGDPLDLNGLDELSSVSGFRLEPVVTRSDELDALIKARLGVGGDTINAMVQQRADDGVELLEELDEVDSELAEDASAPSVIRLVNELLIEALEMQASDVHIEPSEQGLTVRFRVDGMLRVQPVPPEINHFYSAIVTRLKIMSHLNIAEKRLPQDGRIKLRVSGREIDVRVSVIPMIFGEGIVMRILDKDKMVFNLKAVGMPDNIYEPFNDLISSPHGIVLVTGPTGSGKSTTLYSALNEIKNPDTKIITVEDPVEYHSNGISQIQVHSRIGLTFAAGLRSILRHDPDVILIGEIRDNETAQSAIQASLTGHLVFSTLHTNDAPSAFTRLIDMGVEPYLVASTVEGILAQRLVRRLCKHCKVEIPSSGVELPDYHGDWPETIWQAGGCRECRDTGYSGRIGIYELLRTDPEMKNMCAENVSAGDIRNHALKKGMISLRGSGLEKVALGITSLEEIMRVTRGDVS
ncbi:MAG: GspE/PulE family protein [Planctomycetaceae bacterium]